MVEPLIDCTPDCIHLMLCDKERAFEISKDASKSTAIFIGAGVSGPVTACVAAVLADAVITGIDSYKSDQYKANELSSKCPSITAIRSILHAGQFGIHR